MPTAVDRDDVQRLVTAGAQLIEVLPAAEFKEEHLPGAINIPLKELDRQSAALDLEGVRRRQPRQRNRPLSRS